MEPPRNDYAFEFQGPREDLPLVKAALSEWNDCGVVHVGLAEEGIPITFVPGTHIGNDITVGMTYWHPTRTEYVHGWDTRAVIAHEIGHAMGLDHTEFGLMNKYVFRGEHVTPLDCSALAER